MSSNEPPTDNGLRDRVQRILDLLRPEIQSDGGDVELVNIRDDGVVEVRFLGACVTCPSSTMTLQVGIEQNLKQNIPEVTAVTAVT